LVIDNDRMGRKGSAKKEEGRGAEGMVLKVEVGKWLLVDDGDINGDTAVMVQDPQPYF
jgi:hypothetical protein